MTNNDILRRIRFIFDLSDKKVIALFTLGECEVTRADISDWLKKDDHADFKPCEDETMARFLNGLIAEKRGKREGDQPIVEKRLNNNIIFRKLKIALNLKAEEILAILDSVNFRLGKSELSAFFRKPSHELYRECQNQILRNFLQGLQLKFRGDSETTD